MDLKKQLGENLRNLIKKKNVSLEKFAYENGISKGYIYDIAKGEANASLEMLEKLASALKVTPCDLIK